MALAKITPFWLRSTSTTVSNAHTSITSGHKYAMVLTTKDAMTIRYIDWYILSKPVSDNNSTIRIETVNASTGTPTGTLWAANTEAVSPVTAIGINTATLTADATFAAGDRFAVVRTAVDGAAQFNPMRWVAIRSSTPTNVDGPLYMLDTGGGYGSFAHHAFAGGFRDASGVPIQHPDCLYIEGSSLNFGTLRSSWVGARISYPVPIRICGAALNITSEAANNSGDITVRVYDSSTAPGGTPYAERTYPKQASTWQPSSPLRNIQFTPIELAVGDWIDVVASYTDVPGAGNQRVYGANITGLTVWRGDLWRGFPTTVEVYDNSGSWATNEAMEPDVSIMVSGFDDGAGGGGGTPNLTRLLQRLSGASLNG